MANKIELYFDIDEHKYHAGIYDSAANGILNPQWYTRFGYPVSSVDVPFIFSPSAISPPAERYQYEKLYVQYNRLDNSSVSLERLYSQACQTKVDTFRISASRQNDSSNAPTIKRFYQIVFRVRANDGLSLASQCAQSGVDFNTASINKVKDEFGFDLRSGSDAGDYYTYDVTVNFSSSSQTADGAALRDLDFTFTFSTPNADDFIYRSTFREYDAGAPQCPSGQEWNGYQCVPITPPPNPGTCTIDAILTVDDKGSNLYRIQAAPTGAQNPALVVSWKRDGAALASTALFIEETITKNAAALFICTIDDGNCRIVRTIQVKNEDGGNGSNGCEVGFYREVEGGPCIRVPATALPAVPLAPTVAKNCADAKIAVTAPALPARAVSLEIARDDAPETSIATATFDDANAGQEPRKYRARAINDAGASAWGPWSAAVALVSSALQIAWLTPDADATISRPTWLRFSLADTGETVDACGNASLPVGACASLDVADAQIELYLGDYLLPVVQIARTAGSPRNGVYAFAFSPLDYSSGAKTLRVRARGSDCCFAAATRAVVVENSLHGNVFYRDVYRADAPDGQIIGRANVGVEVWPVVENTARNFWVQHAVRSGTALDGPYQHDDWIKHQPIVLTPGEKHDAQGIRIARQQWGTPVTLNLPHKPQIRVREKYTKQWALAAFDCGAATVAKLREIEPGRHLVWATGEAKAFIYDGGLTPIFVGAECNAGDATDAALLGDKLFVVRPGELFAYDTDEGQTALVYTVRGETRAPKFVERVGARALAIYVDAAQTPATRCYDLTFATPRLVWELADAATFCAPVAGGLAVGCGAALWVSSDGVATPSLAHTFGAAVSAASSDFVGLANGEVWTRANLARVLTRDGSIGGVATWSGGTTGEVAGELPARGVAGGAGDWLSGQKQSGAWFDEVELTLPVDLTSKTVSGVSALELFALDLPSLSGDGDAESVKQRDERLLVGTLGGVLFVYQRSALSEQQGAIATSQTTMPRVLPFPMMAKIEV